ncbi:hypothetical protein CEXT_447761 [Caerostris extrusa]|uniref:Uncharacterized protein n=1 Tax=Caerostris extrusa TaxID=172846 RepID=A0AAV4V0Y5_CAEEX|nr:hypothetical protein CEXT_447761 [Caerostris extrusa]
MPKTIKSIEEMGIYYILASTYLKQIDFYPTTQLPKTAARGGLNPKTYSLRYPISFLKMLAQQNRLRRFRILPAVFSYPLPSKQRKNNPDFAYESSFPIYSPKPVHYRRPYIFQPQHSGPVVWQYKELFLWIRLRRKLRPMATFVTQAHGFALEHA